MALFLDLNVVIKVSKFNVSKKSSQYFELDGSLFDTLMIAFTSSGTTALISSKLNPSIPIIAPTDDLFVAQKMALYRGVTPLLLMEKFSKINSWSEMIKIALNDAKKYGVVKEGDLAIVTAGYPFGRPGGTNSIRMIEVQ